MRADRAQPLRASARTLPRASALQRQLLAHAPQEMGRVRRKYYVIKFRLPKKKATETQAARAKTVCARLASPSTCGG